LHTEPLYDDASLISGLAGRKREAFEAIYKKYFTSLFYFAKRYVKDEDAAEDIVTEAFMKLWDRPESFEDLKKLQNFLFLITRNACINHLPIEHRKSEREIKYTVLATSDPEQEELTALIYQHICTEVEKMPGQLRQIFKLSYVEGLSNEEIAEKLGIIYSTVSNHKNRLLNLLRDKFKGREIFTLMAFWQALALFSNRP
jgi:RNA polymerase sigma-70 factor (family 1)